MNDEWTFQNLSLPLNEQRDLALPGMDEEGGNATERAVGCRCAVNIRLAEDPEQISRASLLQQFLAHCEIQVHLRRPLGKSRFQTG